MYQVYTYFKTVIHVFISCVCVCVWAGVPECCGVHVEVSGNLRSGFSPSTLWIPGLRLSSSHLEVSAIINGTNSGSQRFVLM